VLRKKYLGKPAASCAILLLSLALRSGAQANPPGPWGYLPESLPDRVTEAALKSLASERNEIWGFIGRDYSKKDLSELSPAFMAPQAFDQETRWPGKGSLPASFDPKAWLERARDPGLGLSRLHATGVTGAGVSVPVIDKPIRATHSELAGIVYAEVFGGDGRPRPVHFHGLACASILAGRTCGVAPGARLYYFAVPDDGKNFLNYSRAGGVLSGFSYGGCPPFLDRDDPSNYSRSSRFAGPQRGKVILPADFRATASNAGDGAYVYWGRGGYSWAMPYAAGLAALAWQVRPGLKYAEIEDALRKTAFSKADGEKVVAPEAFIAEIREFR
jgi:serine protease AprX